MIKDCANKIISIPTIADGYRYNDVGQYEIEYITGDPFPDNLAREATADIQCSESDTESDSDIYDDDDEEAWQ